jgi:translation initiation factor 6
MYVTQTSIHGEDFIGLLGFASDRYAVLALSFRDYEALGVPMLKTKVYGTNLVGMFCAGNSNGILVPYFISDAELDRLRRFVGDLGVEVGRVGGEYTALGNMIACNDRGAFTSNAIRDYRTVEDILDVEVVSGDIAGHREVGAYIMVTNKGFLMHPEAEKQLPELMDIFKVGGMAGTVNCGVPFVKSGLIANSNGYITGNQTTGIELQRIDDALGFI